MKNKVYIVEDHEDMRFILKRTLTRSLSDIQVVGESETAEQAIKEIPVLCPDIVLVDISLPGMDGIELIRILRPKCHCLWLLVVTGHTVDEYKKEALEAGADGIVSKSDFGELIGSLKKMLNNKREDKKL